MVGLCGSIGIESTLNQYSKRILVRYRIKRTQSRMSEKEGDVRRKRSIYEVFEDFKTPRLIQLVVGIMKVLARLYDVISYIPYKLIVDPEKNLENSNRIKARPKIPSDPSSPWQNTYMLNGQMEEDLVLECKTKTLDQIWDESVRIYGSRRCMGVREVLNVTLENQESRKVFEKLKLGNYHWLTYSQVADQVNAVARGLLEEGHERNTKVVIFAETRSEWMITALACFKSQFPVMTVYATLGIDALTHAINEGEACSLFTTATLVGKVIEAINKDGNMTIRRLIYYPTQDPETKDEIIPNSCIADIKMLRFCDLINIGFSSDRKLILSPPMLPEDLAIIMYTSGTTGTPKGVMISHENLIAATASQSRVADIRSDDVYIGYLPLAHIMEICVELVSLSKGCAIGYSSPQTLFDNAPKLNFGESGDIQVLQPTLVAFVPLMLERLNKMMMEKVSKLAPFMQEVFRLFYERRLNQYRKGYTHTIFDRLVFNRFKHLIGNRIRLAICGGAPLSAETQEFTSICFSCPLLQGYGLTETCGCGTISSVNDLTTGTVGPPLDCCEIMLREWLEGGYLPTNSKPQGEIMIGGKNVTLGYYKCPQKTAEAFEVIDGKRWFSSGDIGEFREDGSLHIIDRKKDLVKLAHAEYVSLSKIETTLQTNPFVDNVCVVANSAKDYIICLVVPNKKHLRSVAEQLGFEDYSDEILYENDKIMSLVLINIKNYCSDKLLRHEIPQKLRLLEHPWLPTNGLVTEAFKLKRKAIESHFSKEIEAMWNDDGK